jgi:hypothetical protein
MTKQKALEYRVKLIGALRGPVFALELPGQGWVVIWKTADEVAHVLDTAADAAAVLEAQLS